MFYKTTKRTLDILISIFCILISLPFLFIIALSIKFNSPKGPILYVATRAAQHNGTFNLFKFRTMVPDAESLGGHSTALNDLRLTRVGKFLRKYKLDEIPQFLNVIKGEMSLVGPRPQVTFYTNKYEGANLNILSVKPGITDIASIKFIDMDKTLGTEEVDFVYENEIEPKKNKLRLEYVQKQSFKLDIIILVITFLKLIRFIDEEKIGKVLNRI